MVEEILDWDQDDLDNYHLNILDTSNDIYLWIGQRANYEDEKKQAMETVLLYASNHQLRVPSGAKDRVLIVRAFHEPIIFTSHFHAWDNKGQHKTHSDKPITFVEDTLHELNRVYSLAELINPPKMLDSTKLESYLAMDEFLEIFKMNKEVFYSQPLWKQEQQKKQVGLY